MRFLPFKMALKALVIDQPYHSIAVSKMIEKQEEDSLFYSKIKLYHNFHTCEMMPRGHLSSLKFVCLRG